MTSNKLGTESGVGFVYGEATANVYGEATANVYGEVPANVYGEATADVYGGEVVFCDKALGMSRKTIL